MDHCHSRLFQMRKCDKMWKVLEKASEDVVIQTSQSCSIGLSWLCWVQGWSKRWLRWMFELRQQSVSNWLEWVNWTLRIPFWYRVDNHGLQHTVAILERIYKEVNFPNIYNHPNLPKSPFELGISRADLWAFAALVALDEVQLKTKKLCHDKPFTMMCGDNSTSCFSPYPMSGKFMFKTGRSDCIPKSGATEFQVDM